MTSARFAPPVPITRDHDVNAFSCGEPSLDQWLRRQALRNEIARGSRTYVVSVDERVVGYYSLAAGAIERNNAPKVLQRNMPDPLPMIVLGRLAIDQQYQSEGIGSALLRDAILRAARASDIVGARAILVHALSDRAREWYLGRGFLNSPIHPLTLCLPIETVRRASAESGGEHTG